MAIPKEIKDFVSGLVDYYVSTASSYRDLAQTHAETANSVDDVALGMITGIVYSSFMQAYQNQQKSPSLDDIREFNELVRLRSSDIKKAIAESGSVS